MPLKSVTICCPVLRRCAARSEPCWGSFAPWDSPAALDCHSTTNLERETGIEPASSVWKTDTLPLSYSRVTLCTELISRVLSSLARMTIIRLGRTSLHASSSQPAVCYRLSPTLFVQAGLTAYLRLHPVEIGRFTRTESARLFPLIVTRVTGCPAVSWYGCLWCPDFPPPACVFPPNIGESVLAGGDCPTQCKFGATGRDRTDALLVLQTSAFPTWLP